MTMNRVRRHVIHSTRCTDRASPRWLTIMTENHVNEVVPGSNLLWRTSR
ncbi:hypothetical protein HMPREF9597_01346 [Cutibacterium acnes HL005PA4]|nr:hypothetical protein HMPREF9597_01346 [Cutibacterium acnes HL005PA4]EFT20212.1 hypothetical protein HMPREF9566_02143 [Cutibacterium acnes HL045PA1]EFT52535.1 hypothetical protein HMPREF9569_01842 [Cutibacterium acnes HL078PA1]EFT57551.1 hypothetical protein HMPREF9615_01864 [Cutibacterium acnes HL002PA3]